MPWRFWHTETQSVSGAQNLGFCCILEMLMHFQEMGGMNDSITESGGSLRKTERFFWCAKNPRFFSVLRNAKVFLTLEHASISTSQRLVVCSAYQYATASRNSYTCTS